MEVLEQSSDMKFLVETTIGLCNEIEAIYAQMYDLLGVQPDSKLFDSVFRLELLIVSILDGISKNRKSSGDDTPRTNWLEWYLFENLSGNGGLTVDGEVIDTVDKLLILMGYPPFSQ